ncbi:hypothetical protein QJS10_CPA08g01566 [Acorus calamus]|uniref:E3 ubiquitin-protein ligase WAV3-like C-terminal domain-containing protein n=1 Tax=Acorus calamus TaxID=4465 RepID=A0AAV9E8L4_ACOCL|nr:hypothetical protein QJS10_CPA08g01566 [Acorus calamus]
MPRVITSSDPKIERLWNLSVTSRAMAESRQLFEHGEYSATLHLLSSARRCSEAADDGERGVTRNDAAAEELVGGEKAEALMSTSTWRAVERPAKLEIVRIVHLPMHCARIQQRPPTCSPRTPIIPLHAHADNIATALRSLRCAEITEFHDTWSLHGIDSNTARARAG